MRAPGPGFSSAEHCVIRRDVRAGVGVGGWNSPPARRAGVFWNRTSGTGLGAGSCMRVACRAPLSIHLEVTLTSTK